MLKERYATVTTWAAADTTVGKVAFIGLQAAGSAADSTITILDGTAIKHVLLVGSTVNNFSFLPSWPVAYRNLVIDITGTASFSIMSIPTT